MKEIKFDNEEILDIEKDIKNSKKIEKYDIKNKVLLSIVICLSTFTIGTIMGINFAALSALSLGNLLLSYGIINGICGLNYLLKAKRVNKTFSSIINNYNDDNKPTYDNIKESVIIKNHTRNIQESNYDGRLYKDVETQNDKFYLYLDSSDNMQGILETEIIHQGNDNTTRDKNYYLLEEKELNELSGSVSKVKRLVKTKY